MDAITEAFVVIWLLIGMGVAATMMFFCLGNIGTALANVAKSALDYVLLSILVVLIFAWAVVTGPVWVLIINLRPSTINDCLSPS